MPEMPLKKGWTRVGFGDVVKLSGERSSNPEEDGFERFVGLEHIDPGDLKIRRWGDIADGTTFTSVFRPGQVLFGKRRAYQGKVAVADFSGVCSGDIYVLEPRDTHLLPELLPFICQTDGFFEHAVGTSAGSLSPRTNWDSLASYEFALPPLQEQRRIANALALHDSVRETLLRLGDTAAELRLALLERLFPSPGEVSARVALGEFLDRGQLRLQTGPFGTVLAAAQYVATGWPIVNPTHIRNGRVVHDGGPCVDASTAKRLQNYRMASGDILLARKGEIEKATLVTDREAGWIVGSDCILLRMTAEPISPAYLLLFLQSPSTGRNLRSLAHGTVMPGLNEGMLARLELPMKSPPEQLAAVELVHELDVRAGDLAERLEAVDLLRRALLARALHQERIEER